MCRNAGIVTTTMELLLELTVFEEVGGLRN